MKTPNTYNSFSSSRFCCQETCKEVAADDGEDHHGDAPVESNTLPTLMQTTIFLKIPLYKPILRFVDFLCMSIKVHLQKTRASFVLRFNFGGLSFKKKFGFQIANFQKNLNFCQKQWIFEKNYQG